LLQSDSSGSASTLTTFETIAIGRGPLQDTSRRCDGVRCPQFKDRYWRNYADPFG